VTYQRYSDRLLLCLGTYQFIEETLRFCLIRCHATTKFRLDGYLPYHFSLQGIEDAALGRLIEWYKSYTVNEELIRDLQRIKKTRDYLAHRGLALTVEESSNEVFMSDLLTKLKQAQTQADECFKQLEGEMQTTDDAVNRAYKTLKTDYAANNKTPPKAFEDKPPELDES
jgi:hypothetical protein